MMCSKLLHGKLVSPCATAVTIDFEGGCFSTLVTLIMKFKLCKFGDLWSLLILIFVNFIIILIWTISTTLLMPMGIMNPKRENGLKTEQWRIKGYIR